MQSRNSKLSRLNEWQEQDEEAFYDDLEPHVTGAKLNRISITRASPQHGDFLPEDLETLRLSPNKAGLSPPAFIISDTRNRASLGPLDQLAELGDEDLSFGEEIGPTAFTKESLRRLLDMHKHLPGSFASLSPTRRKSYDGYENSDTDVTEIDEEDFEGIDDIFGKEESGILSSHANSDFAQNMSRASITLNKRKQDLQKAAEMEEREWKKRYELKYGNDPRTLTKNDLRRYVSNLSKKPSIFMEAQYHENGDDEPFEEGFENLSPESLNANRLPQFRRSTNGRNAPPLSHKVSLPSLQRPIRPEPTFAPVKYRSTMDLTSALKKDSSEHPTYNKNNNLIKKLNRMPSFHTSTNNSSPGRKDQQTTMDVGLERDQQIHDMEKRKAELLEKYREISEQQAELRMSPIKRSDRPPSKATNRKKKVGLLRNLNYDNPDYYSTGSSNRNMKYNSNTRTWEGNEHDLLRFEDDLHDTIREKKPSLITHKEFGQTLGSKNGNMRYDAENLRWVNLDKVNEETENEFDELPDLVPDDLPQYGLPRSMPKRLFGDRGVSQFTQRTVLSASSGSSVGGVPVGNEFVLSDRLMARFEKEEQKIEKKTKEWFDPRDRYNIRHPPPFSNKYFWEIRAMVMDTNDNA